MQGFSFETFQVSDGNRAAFHWCQDAAAAPDKIAGTVVLLGPEGTGKTHLLWSIVKAIRSSETPMGLALVVPGNFPGKVRQLVENPEPIQKARALLLVDGLESYREELPDLEAVIEVFLANRQAVVLSSNVHPQRLSRLSSRLRAILSAGRIVELQRDHAAAADEEDALLGRIARLEDERAQLKEALGRRANADNELARAREAVESLRAENESLKRALADLPSAPSDAESLRESIVQLQQENESLLAALDEAARGDARAAEADQERERLRARIAELETAGRALLQEDTAALRAQLEEAQAEADAALARQALLQGQLAAAKHAAEEMAALRAERDRLASDLDRFRQDAETAVAIIESRTAERAEVERKILKSLESFTVRLFARENPKINEEEWQRLEAELGDARSLGEAFRKQLAAERAHFQVQLKEAEQELEHLQGLLDEARADQGRLKTTVDSLRGRLQSTEFELEKARKQLALQHAEMDALRHEAASQVASAHMQAGAMEHRLSGLEETFLAIREAGKATGVDIRQYSGELANMAGVLDSLATRLARLQELMAEPPASAHGDDTQGVLFDPDTLRIRATLARPASSDGAADPPALPRRDPNLRDVVQQALALDDPGKSDPA